MASRTLVDEIITLIQSQANNNPAPQLCEIVNNYEDKSYCDVKIDSLGRFNHVKTIGSVGIGSKGVLVFINGDLNNKVVISETVVEKINLEDIYSALNNKANKVHSHNILDVNNLNNELNSKAEAVHSHVIENITGLSNALNNKANNDHNHDNAYYPQETIDNWFYSLENYVSDWVNVSPVNGNTVMYDTGVSKPKCRKWGKVVQVVGFMKPIKSLSNTSGDLVHIGNLPSGYAPISDVYQINQGSGVNRFLMRVEPNGKIWGGRYGSSSYIPIPTGAWLSIHTTFLTL